MAVYLGLTKIGSVKVGTAGGTVIVPNLTTLTVTPNAVVQHFSPTGNYNGYSSVTVNAIPSQYIIPSGTLNIISNGTGINVASYAAVNVSVPTGSTINNQNKSVTPNESQQTVTADANYTGLGTVTVGAISNTYVGSAIPRMASANLTASGATVSVPAGYYANASSKSVATATQATPCVSVNTSTGLVTATATQTAGYVSAGSKSGTLQLSTAAGTTITPTTSEQTAITANKYTTGAIKVAAIPSQYIVPTGTIEITANGTNINVAQYASANVYVSAAVTNPTISALTVTPNETQQTFNAASIDGYKPVTINAIPNNYIGSAITQHNSNSLTASGATVTVPAGYYSAQATKSVATATQATPCVSINTTSGLVTATATQTAGYVSAGSTSGTLQLSTQAAASITPSESQQTAVAANKYTTGAVTVKAIPNNYIGSAITQRNSADLTASGATVSVPAGYYSAQATKSVSTATQATPSVSVNTSSGLVTATATQTAGYVSAGSKSGTLQLTTVGATTITPNETSQTAVAANRYTTGTITVAAIPSTYKNLSTTTNATSAHILSGRTAYNSSGTLITGSIGSKAAATYNTSTSDQSIASGQYLSGAQTIKAVTTANLTAANVAAGVNVKVGDANSAGRIVNITGTYTSDANAIANVINNGYTAYVNGAKITGNQVIQHYYTGTTAPNASLGSIGDIYLQYTN